MLLNFYHGAIDALNTSERFSTHRSRSNYAFKPLQLSFILHYFLNRLIIVYFLLRSAVAEETPVVVEEKTVEEVPEAVEEVKVDAPEAATNGDAPEATNGDTPKATNGDAPEATNGDAPKATNGDAEATNGDAPKATNGDAPEATNGEAAVEATNGDSNGHATNGDAVKRKADDNGDTSETVEVSAEKIAKLKEVAAAAVEEEVAPSGEEITA